MKDTQPKVDFLPAVPEWIVAYATLFGSMFMAFDSKPMNEIRTTTSQQRTANGGTVRAKEVEALLGQC